MSVSAGMEMRYLGARVKVMRVRGDGNRHVADVLYMSGSCAGLDATVNEDDLEELTAYARPELGQTARALA